MKDKKQLVLFEHTNGNAIRMIENVFGYNSAFEIQIKGSDTDWSTIRRYNRRSKKIQWPEFYKMQANLDYIKITRSHVIR
jgi:hypothetical protein